MNIENLKVFGKIISGKKTKRDSQKYTSEKTSDDIVIKVKPSEQSSSDSEKESSSQKQTTNTANENVSSPAIESEDAIPITPRASFIRQPVDRKFTILLVENNSKVAQEKDILSKIVSSVLSSGYVCVINYGTEVRTSKIFYSASLEEIPILDEDDINDNTCLYDALEELEKIIGYAYMQKISRKDETIRINKIEVIGIGTCIDNCSKASKRSAIDCFCRILEKSNVTTKYFCLTEESFLAAAEIGFRSVGAISRKY